jgi:hypothetical protein
VLNEPGDAVLVRRGVLRSMVMSCPDGCGEVLTVNLDGRAGKAWRHYARGDDVSLFPSVWRDSGCESHYILWRSRIYWCDWGDELELPMAEVVTQVQDALRPQLERYAGIAENWTLFRGLCCLHAAGFASRAWPKGRDKLRGRFRSAARAK